MVDFDILRFRTSVATWSLLLPLLASVELELFTLCGMVNGRIVGIVGIVGGMVCGLRIE